MGREGGCVEAPFCFFFTICPLVGMSWKSVVNMVENIRALGYPRGTGTSSVEARGGVEVLSMKC